MPGVSQLPYRLGVGLIILNADSQVFVAKRIDTQAEAWQMPQGGIDQGEDPLEAVFREMEEEIGTNRATIIAESADWYTYDLPEELVGKIWKGKYRGQKQKWYLMRFDGTDADINIDTPDPEFQEWKWARPETLPDLIVPFKRQLYQQLITEFQQYF